MNADHNYVSERMARTIVGKPQRAPVSGTDAWGKTRTWVVEWLPETCGADAAMDNVGKVGLVWDGWCPVHAKVTQSGSVRLVAPPVAGAATWSCVHTSVSVETADEMVPGTWRIVEER